MRRARSDSGVTIVEAAFILPLLFMFVFGMVDLGMWAFNTNKAANAARDGARSGILSYETADQAGADRDAIVAAVRAHLPDATVEESDVVITCVRDGATIDCDDAVIDEDHIRVEVEWGWDLVTPIAGVIGVNTGMARASASMAIVGAPLPGSGAPAPEEPEEPVEPPPEAPPEGCAAATLSATPTSISSKGNQLEESLLIEFTTNQSAGCTALRIELVGTKPNPTTLEYSCGCDGPQYQWVYRGSNNIWQPGTGTVRLLNANVVLGETTFTVT